MQPDANIDSEGDSGLNTSKNVNNENENDIVIRLDELEPLNDPDCKHKFVRDPDTIGEFRAWKCSKCHRGVFLHKQVTKIT